MITVAEHLDRVLAALEPLPPGRVPLRDALGAALAEAVVARHPLPLFDNAAMDGYAVRATDTVTARPDAPVSLRVVADVRAGSDADPAIGRGEAARIMTGAAMPTDADTVVPLEQTQSGVPFPSSGSIVLTRPAGVGAHVRGVGEELRRGDTVLAPPLVLGPRHLAAAAAAGHEEVTVRPAPRVAVFATGDELVPPGAPMGRGRIPESNSTLLAGLVRAAGGHAAYVAALGDDPQALRDEVARVQASVDLIVCSGGVGAGAYDVVRNAFREVIAFERVAMQPGRPQAFGRLPGGPALFGLPGNPVAAAVSFEAFVRPALARLRGLDEPGRAVKAVACEAWAARDDREQYVPVTLEASADGRLLARPAGAGRSHFVAHLADADGYAIVPLGVAEVREGDVLAVLRATG